jgi:hypothetical protein
LPWLRKAYSIGLLLILMLFYVDQLSLAETKIFRPEDNAVFLDQRDPDENKSYQRGILTASELDENTRIVIHFDLLGWTPNLDSILGAQLHLFHYRGGNYTDYRTLNAYPLITGFDETTVTWLFPWTTPGGDYDNTITTTADIPLEWENWVHWDVTDIMKNRWSFVANCGLLIKDPIEDTPPPDGPYVRFRSHRYADEAPDEIPYLLVHYGFISGDANGDQNVAAGDIVFLLSYLFRNGSEPDPYDSGDANCDGQVGSGDIVYLLSYLYRGGFHPGCEYPPGGP